jgi:hypothetical protein
LVIADVSSASYSNHLCIGWSAFEFMLAFSQYREGDEGPLAVASLVTAPAFAKAFLNTLNESIASYEERFGQIPELATSETDEPIEARER